MISRINTATIKGIKGEMVLLETDISNGLPNFTIVGLADTMVKEAKERIRTAIRNSNCKYPNNRITVSLSPAYVRKKGTHFDLAMAVGVLLASRQIYEKNIADSGFIGELALDGTVNGVVGVLPMVMNMKENGIRQVFLPKENSEEASLVKGIEIYPIESLDQLINHFNLNNELLPMESSDGLELENDNFDVDFSDVKGLEYAKRAIVIATAGGHGLLMKGSPSGGKTMLAKRVPTILPKMDVGEILDTTMIYSVSRGKELYSYNGHISKRPFRQPNYTITKAGLIGGGMEPLPGEISLAHNGVLFLDEVFEFDKQVIDSLRVPLENKEISIFRRGKNYVFPANFMLIAATNPCKCGYYGDKYKDCKCTERELEAYRNKLSAPILERIDMSIDVIPIDYQLLKGEKSTSSKEMRDLVKQVRDIQKRRYESLKIDLNSQMGDEELRMFCSLDNETEEIVKLAFDRKIISPRTYKKVLRVARTIADLNHAKYIRKEHLCEALQFRETLND